jgi:hypothetical protein
LDEEQQGMLGSVVVHGIRRCLLKRAVGDFSGS